MIVSGIVFLAIICGSALGQGDLSLIVNIENVTLVQQKNSIFGKWSATVIPAKPMNQVSLETPLAANLPDTWMVKFRASVGGTDFPEYDISACETVKNEMIGKSLVAKGKPFPESCPFEKGNWAIEKWVVDTNKIPPGVPDGKIEVIVDLYEVGGPPVITFYVTGTMSHKTPGMG